MEDKNKKTSDPFEPESHSAFSGRGSAPKPAQPTGDKPIPSQPRSFSPVRPQRAAQPRKDLASTPAAETKPQEAPLKAGPAAMPEKPAAGASSSSATATATAPEKNDKPAAAAAPLKDTGLAADKDAPAKAAPEVGATQPVPQVKHSTAGAAATAAVGAVAGSAVIPPGSTSSAEPASRPQSSAAGGDTIRLRVQPRPHARTLNTAPGRGLRRRLPDIRQGKAPSSSTNYGPFSMLFGFLWLLFKMVFFTLLVLGLGALIGFVAMTEYIRTPEVTVPSVVGMKVNEAFDVLGDKNLGIIRLRREKSPLTPPGEIISQQPQGGSLAKEKTDISVVISSGASQFVVPNVVGETRENAENKIKGAKLEVGTVLPMEHESLPKGTVISQSPIGGEGSEEPVQVNLMISSGPASKSLTMPDLSGRTVLEAKAGLEALGITDVATEPADAPADAKVLSHTPLVGKTVFQNDKVTLITNAKK